MERQTLVALGASNLTRGFATVVNTARAALGEALDVVAALGHGRSYGIRSAFLFRSLPGIMESGLWPRLAPHSPSRGRALITDVGNDILYHVPVDTLLGWVRDCATRLSELGFDVVLTDLPIDGLRRLSPLRFALFRSVFAPKRAGESLLPRRAILGRVVDPRSGFEIDEAIATSFQSPQSYTGEDMCEFSLHGSPVLVSALLDCLCGVVANHHKRSCP